MKYPSNWSVYDDSSACENNPNKEKTYNPIKIQSFTRPYECEGHSGFGGSGVLINVFVDEKHSTINQWIENIKKVDDSMQINIVKDIVIGGMSGKELTMSCDCLVGSDFDRLIEKNGKVYEFSVASPDVNLNDYLSIIDQILSTFKFLD